MRRFTALLISVWLGLHIGFGFIAAPVAFNSLHQLANGRQMAGDIAGMLFHCADLFGIVAWLFAAVITRQDSRLNYNVKSRTPAWINVLLICLAVNGIFVCPRYRRAQTQPEQLAAQFNWRRHGRVARQRVYCVLHCCADWVGAVYSPAALGAATLNAGHYLLRKSRYNPPLF